MLQVKYASKKFDLAFVKSFCVLFICLQALSGAISTQKSTSRRLISYQKHSACGEHRATAGSFQIRLVYSELLPFSSLDCLVLALYAWLLSGYPKLGP